MVTRLAVTEPNNANNFLFSILFTLDFIAEMSENVKLKRQPRLPYKK
jgi:hypothetical protein